MRRRTGWRRRCWLGLEFEHVVAVFPENFPGNGGVRTKAPDGFDLLAAAATVAFAGRVVTVASVDEFVLVPFEEAAGVVFVAEQGVEAGTGGHVAVHVGVVTEVTVREAAGGDLCAGIENFLLQFLIDVAPPRLGVADEVNGGVFLQDAVEALEADVIGIVLEVKENGYLVVAGDLGDQVDVGRVGVDGELLLSDADGSQFEVFFDHGFGVVRAGALVREENKLGGKFTDEVEADIIAARAGRETVTGAGGEENGFGDAHFLLVSNHLLVGAAGVWGVLMEIEDGLRGGGGEDRGEGG